MRNRHSATRESNTRFLTGASCLREQATVRRGNTLVLVAGVLALLVIIATAFVTRTQGGRVTGPATQNIQKRTDDGHVIGAQIAQEIKLQLFAMPVDPTDPAVAAGQSASSNFPRLKLQPDAVRYGVDLGDAVNNITGLPGSDGLIDHPYNRAPYHTVPFTNWPDGILNASPGLQVQFGRRLPFGPGNASTVAGADLDLPNGGNPAPDYLRWQLYNPPGNPGFGDFRALADYEPMRFASGGGGFNITNADPTWRDAFSHWLKLTYLGRPNNGLRVVTDISDIGDLRDDGFGDGTGSGLGSLVTDLSLPIEQWTTIPPRNSRMATTGSSRFTNANEFFRGWARWFSLIDDDGNGIQDYYDVFHDWEPWLGAGTTMANYDIPANFYNLKDLDADGIILEVGERPRDEFVPGTARWHVSRVLADADGDGFTDSFWHLVPTPTADGHRQIIAVRIIDNNAMVNVNSATQFDPGAQDQSLAYWLKLGNVGETPADMALLGQGFPGTMPNPGTNHANVGLYDNFLHSYPPPLVTGISTGDTADRQFGYDPSRFARHKSEVGLKNPTNNIALNPLTRAIRMDYWKRSASRPLFPDPASLFTPFALDDELELRAFHGNNFSWQLSRLEWSVQDLTPPTNANFFRGNVKHNESVQTDQWTKGNRMLVADSRRKVTTFNGARNDIMPSYLWRSDYIPFGLNPNEVQIDAEYASRRKIDLRQARGTSPLTKFVVGEQADREWRQVTRDTIERALMMRHPGEFAASPTLQVDGAGAYFKPVSAVDSSFGTYFGTGGASRERVQEVAAFMAANIEAYRDNVQPDANGFRRDPYPLEQAVPVNDYDLPSQPTKFALGIEKQPFLVEAFIAHVHASEPLPSHPAGLAGHPGNYVDSTHATTTVLAVQIANPFDEPLVLDDFEIRVFDKPIALSGVLQPTTEFNNQTVTIVSCAEQFAHDSKGTITDFRARWVDFLNLDTLPSSVDNMPLNSVVFIDNPSLQSRDTYDGYAGEFALELRRIDPSGISVVVDRFDYEPGDADHKEFLNQTSTLPKPPQEGNGENTSVTPNRPWLAGIRIGPSNDTWVTWARVTRAWGLVDTEKSSNEGSLANQPSRLRPHERAPRYVIATQQVTVSDNAFEGDPNQDPADTTQYVGDAFEIDSNPDGSDPNGLIDGWFVKEYINHRGDPHLHKPTFFNNIGVENYLAVTNAPTYNWPASNVRDKGFPDKGFYGTYYPPMGSGPMTYTITNDDDTTGPTLNEHGLMFSLQMLQKDADFVQVGELLNVWMYGHLVDGNDDPATPYSKTIKTFSEYLREESRNFRNVSLDADGDGRVKFGEVVDARLMKSRLGRLHAFPASQVQTGTLLPQNQVIGVVPSSTWTDAAYFRDPRHSVPDLPGTARLLEAFVCDGPGVHWDSAFRVSPDLAAGFSGRATPGQLNINTASIEAMRSAPHWYKIVHRESSRYSDMPRVMMAEAVAQYRDRLSGNRALAGEPLHPAMGVPLGPDFSNMAPQDATVFGGGYVNNLPAFAKGIALARRERGFATIGEVLQMQQMFRARNYTSNQPVYLTSVNSPLGTILASAWRPDFASLEPFAQFTTGFASGANISTDVTGNLWYPVGPLNSGSIHVATADKFAGSGDAVSRDIEEQNLLFAGASNLITTRSDTFTVYFKVRTFKQNAQTGVWDATDPEMIVEDSRYVMLVDRSNVNRPVDTPRILYMEKLPY